MTTDAEIIEAMRKGAGEMMPENPTAFPVPEVRDLDGCGIMEGSPGMSLRDFFAAHALGGMAQSAGFQGAPWEKLAKDAYLAADAMLIQRGQPHD